MSAVDPTVTRSLEQECTTTEWLFQEVAAGRVLPIIEAQALARQLYVIMHAEEPLVVPLIRLKQVEGTTISRALNVAVLAMAFAEFKRHTPDRVRSVGLAALLRDVGMALVPSEIAEKTGRLDPAEWARMRRHTVDGARLMLAADSRLDLPAVVAYEHHLRPDGEGYPELRYPREPHYVSRVVHVCDVYDSLCTWRPQRRPWPFDRALMHLDRHAGQEFSRREAKEFVRMMSGGGYRVLVVRDPSMALPLA